jgi:hypothetical protein
MMRTIANLFPVRVAAVAASVGFVAIAAFQAALALGAPLGRAAWGGSRPDLPFELRIASGVAIVIWLLAATIVLGRIGIEVLHLPDDLLRRGTWVLVGVLTIGALMNFASLSPWERFLWGPVSVTLTALTWIVARSAVDPSPRRSG